MIARAVFRRLLRAALACLLASALLPLPAGGPAGAARPAAAVADMLTRPAPAPPATPPTPLLIALGAASSAPPAPPATPADRARIAAAFRSAPVMFIQNVGQFADGARFQVRGARGTLWLADDALWLTVLEGPHPLAPSPSRMERGWAEDRRGDAPAGAEGDSPRALRGRAAGGEADSPRALRGRAAGGEGAPRRGVNLRLSYVGSNPRPRIEPFDRLDTVVSYFIGSDETRWRPNVPVWGGVRYADLYPGVDLELASEGGRLLQRFVVRDAARGLPALRQARLRVEGAERLALAEGGLLEVQTAIGSLALPLAGVVAADGAPLLGLGLTPGLAAAPSPRAARGPGGEADVLCPFATAAAPPALPRDVAAQTGAADLLYATYLGGSASDEGWAIAVDAAGQAYVAGETFSADFPTTAGAFDRTYGGSYDAFVAKLALGPYGGGLGQRRRSPSPPPRSRRAGC